MTIDLDFRAASRSLARSPGFIAAVILSLTLGIGAGAAAFGVIDAVRLRGLPFKDASRLVLLSEVAVVSLLAANAPARRATRVDPVIALRSG